LGLPSPNARGVPDDDVDCILVANKVIPLIAPTTAFQIRPLMDDTV
jgi:hypothetical protein